VIADRFFRKPIEPRHAYVLTTQLDTAATRVTIADSLPFKSLRRYLLNGQSAGQEMLVLINGLRAPGRGCPHGLIPTLYRPTDSPRMALASREAARAKTTRASDMS
jgi:hypothetical protein